MTSSPPPDRRTIGVLGAYVEGWRRVLRAPALWTSAVFVIVIAIAPSMWRSSTFQPFSATLEIGHDSSDEQRAQTFGLFGVGPLPVVLQARAVHAGVDPVASVMTVGIYLFLWGGCLDRLARSRPVGSASFFAACGVYFWRFLRLGVPLGLMYWAVWQWFSSMQPIVAMAALGIINIVAGYTVVRIVVEDRRSALGAIVASFRFVRRRPIAVLALYALNIVTLMAILFATIALTGWALTWMPLWAFRVAIAAALLVHLMGRLALAASQLVYFQHALAHADYTAAPLPMWPDSPAAEAIENLALRQKLESQKSEVGSRR
jgi:hypothetical protein